MITFHLLLFLHLGKKDNFIVSLKLQNVRFSFVIIPSAHFYDYKSCHKYLTHVFMVQ